MNELKLVGAKVPDQVVGWLEVELSRFVMERLQSYIETAKKKSSKLQP